MKELVKIKGLWRFEFLDKKGRLIYPVSIIKNTIVTVGKNELLNDGIDGSTGYMGLISSVDWSQIVVGDTMGSHAGWKEAGDTNAPTYSGTRKTCVWAAAGSGAKALSSALNFTFTGSGTVKGGFIVFGSGAAAAIDDTSGVLLNAALLDEGDRAVVSTDQLNVSCTITLT